MRQATLVYLVRFVGKETPPEVYLGKKKSKYVAGWLNTAGGKVGPQETVKGCAVRELDEEWNIAVNEEDLRSIACIRFLFPSSPDQDLECHVFTVASWRGVPEGTEELGTPELFSVTALPLDRLPPADRFWLPRALNGQFVEMSIELNADFTPIRVLEEQLHPQVS